MSSGTGTSNYYCYGLCFQPIDGGAQFPTEEQLTGDESGIYSQTLIAANGTEEDFKKKTVELSAHYSPKEQVGVSVFKYLFYDKKSKQDTVYSIVKFVTSAGTGTNDVSANQLDLRVFPNPAGDYTNVV